MKYYTAIYLPASHQTALSPFQSLVPEARAVENDKLHITIRYFGQLDARQGNRLKRGLSKSGLSCAPMLHVRNMGVFEHREEVILWAGVGISNTHNLMFLHQHHNRVATGLGLPPHGFDAYRPHVSLLKGAPHLKPAFEGVASSLGPSLGLRVFVPRQFHLMASEGKGSPDRIEGTYDLI